MCVLREKLVCVIVCSEFLNVWGVILCMEYRLLYYMSWAALTSSSSCLRYRLESVVCGCIQNVVVPQVFLQSPEVSAPIAKGQASCVGLVHEAGAGCSFCSCRVGG